VNKTTGTHHVTSQTIDPSSLFFKVNELDTKLKKSIYQQMGTFF